MLPKPDLKVMTAVYKTSEFNPKVKAWFTHHFKENTEFHLDSFRELLTINLPEKDQILKKIE